MNHSNTFCFLLNKCSSQSERDENDGDILTAALGKTARERWKLFKNVTKLGLQRSISAMASASSDIRHADEEDEDSAAGENDDILPEVVYFSI